MKNKKTSYFRPILVIFAIVAVSSIAFVTYKNQVTPIGINEVTTSGTVSLSLTPTTSSVLANTDTTISLVANSGTDKLSLISFELTYDPSKLTVSAPVMGTWLTKQLSPITVANGKITGEIGAQPDSTSNGGAELSRTGTGTILTFKVKGSTAGTYPITFSTVPSNAWTVTGSTANSSNMLKTVSGTSISITNPRLITDLVGTTQLVDKYDYVELVNQYGKLPAGTADFNGDNAVSGGDYTIFMADYGKTW